MTKRTIYIILGALLIAALVALAWWWFFHRAAPAPTTPPANNFGTAQNATGGTTATTGTQTNIPSTVSGNTDVSSNGTQINPQGSVGSATLQGQVVYNPTYGVVNTGATSYTVPTFNTPIGSTGAVWLSGSPAGASSGPGTGGANTGGSSGGNDTGGGNVGSSTPGTIDTSAPSISNVTADGTVFNPLGINGIDTANPSGGILPNIGGTSSSSNGLGVGGALVGAAAAGAISCGAGQAISWIESQIGLNPGTGSTVGTTGGAPAAASGPAGLLINTAGGVPPGTSVKTSDLGIATQLSGTNLTLAAISAQIGLGNGQKSGTNTVQTFWGCIARTVAKVALQQITASVVNWINSGFNGSPSFVTNPTQFFGNVADNAAGQYIKGSALAFLCSPFQLQIKIAIAQSYANRNAQSCTLSGVINNINNFMNGDFSSGGWAGMLSYTGTPTNNPYGAYAYASIGLNYSVQTATGAQQRQLTLGSGFLDFTQNKNCNPVVGPATAPVASASKSATLVHAGTPGDGADPAIYNVCDIVHTTPGKVIADQLGATQNSVFTELDTAQSFDQIISALVTQLVAGIQGGLANLNNNGAGYESNFYTPDQLQAQASAQTLLTQMQGVTGVVTQYAATEQGAISDIENAQQQLNTLSNCWNTKAQASSTNASVAAQNASLASATLDQMNAQIVNYNNNITNANNGITTLQNLESAALSAASPDDITAITNQYNAAQAQGQILGPADLTNAQQDRTTLQSQLAALNTSTAAGLQQCNAF